VSIGDASKSAAVVLTSAPIEDLDESCLLGQLLKLLPHPVVLVSLLRCHCFSQSPPAVSCKNLRYEHTFYHIGPKPPLVVAALMTRTVGLPTTSFCLKSNNNPAIVSTLSILLFLLARSLRRRKIPTHMLFFSGLICLTTPGCEVLLRVLRVLG
jgi:hypothetical protein